MMFSAPIYRLKRQARLLSRTKGMTLTRALDAIARREGFRSWSLLAARHAQQSPGKRVYQQLERGDLILIGARPGQGKTLLGLEILINAVKNGDRGVFYTLEYNHSDVADRLRALDVDPQALGNGFHVDTSDNISAAYITGQLATEPAGTVVVIDYLQLLDQKRENPDLDDQIADLKRFAQERQLTMVFLSQIDRAYELSEDRFPALSDVRLPNPLDLTRFTKTCFLDNGKVSIASV